MEGKWQPASCSALAAYDAHRVLRASTIEHSRGTGSAILRLPVQVAAALAARHIGGAVNYVAVAEATGMSASAQAAGLAADNLVRPPP